MERWASTICQKKRTNGSVGVCSCSLKCERKSLCVCREPVLCTCRYMRDGYNGCLNGPLLLECLWGGWSHSPKGSSAPFQRGPDPLLCRDPRCLAVPTGDEGDCSPASWLETLTPSCVDSHGRRLPRFILAKEGWRAGVPAFNGDMMGLGSSQLARVW